MGGRFALLSTLLFGTISLPQAASGEDSEAEPATSSTKAFLKEASAGNLERVAEMLKQGQDPNARVKRGWTALELVAMGPSSQMMQRAAKVDGAVGSIREVGDLQTKMTSLLLSSGANPTQKAMTRCRDPEIIRLMVAAGGQPQDALRAAIELKNASLIRDLAEAGADVNVKTDRGRLPLLHAATFSSVEVLELLVELGADPQATEEFGETALHKACSNHRDLEVIESLVRLGVDPWQRSKRGELAAGLVRNRPAVRRYLEGLPRAAQDQGVTAEKTKHIRALIDRLAERGWGARREQDELASSGPAAIRLIVEAIREGAPLKNFLVVFAKAGADAEEAVPLLREALVSPDLALPVAGTLRRMPARYWQQTPASLRQRGAEAAYENFLDPTKGGKEGFVKQYSQAFDRESERYLVKLLGNSRPEVVAFVASGLVHVPFKSSALADSMLKLIEPSVPVRVALSASRTLLVNENLRSPRTATLLVDAISSHDPRAVAELDDRSRREWRVCLGECLGVLRSCGVSPFRALIEKIDSERLTNPPPVGLLLAMGSAEEKDIDTLFTLMRSRSDAVRYAAAETLGLSFSGLPCVGTKLGAFYAGEDEVLRGAAAWALAQPHPGIDAATRRQLVKDERLPFKTRAQAFLSQHDRDSVGPTAEEVREFLPLVVDRIEKGSIAEQSFAISCIRAAGARAEPHLDELRRLRDLAPMTTTEKEDVEMPQRLARVIRMVEAQIRLSGAER